MGTKIDMKISKKIKGLIKTLGLCFEGESLILSNLLIAKLTQSIAKNAGKIIKILMNAGFINQND